MKKFILISGLFSMMACSSVENLEYVEETSEDKPLFRKSLSDYPPFFQNIIGKDSGDFRGVALGMTMAEVRAIENAHHEETDSLTVRYDFEDGIDRNVEVTYQFTQDSLLNQLDMTIFFAKTGARDSLFNDLRTYYKDREKVQGVDANFYWEAQHAKVIIEKGGVPQFPEIVIRFQKKI